MPMKNPPHPGDLILTLGAGSVSQIAPQILIALDEVELQQSATIHQ